jgi:hypothetical protein
MSQSDPNPSPRASHSLFAEKLVENAKRKEH